MLMLQSRPATPARLAEVSDINVLRGCSLEEAMVALQDCYGYYLFSSDVLKELKQTKFFKSLNTAFRSAGYVAARNVGALMDHRWAHETLPLDGWVETYSREVLHAASIFALAKRVAHECAIETDEPFVTALVERFGAGSLWLSVLWVRLFVETDMGFYPEFVGKRMLTERFGNSVRRANAHEENTAHLDLVAVEQVFGYQVKHALFLCRTKNEGFRADQGNNFHSQASWEQETGGQVFYLLAEDLLAGRFNPIPLVDAMTRAGFPVVTS